MYIGNCDPLCKFCSKARILSDENHVCAKKGVVEPDYSCRSFDYDPLKRDPKRSPGLPELSYEDFKLTD